MLGFIGAIKRTQVSSPKKLTSSSKQKTKTNVRKNSIFLFFIIIHFCLGNTRSITNMSNYSSSLRKGVIRGKFAQSSLKRHEEESSEEGMNIK